MVSLSGVAGVQACGLGMGGQPCRASAFTNPDNKEGEGEVRLGGEGEVRLGGEGRVRRGKEVRVRGGEGVRVR